MSGFSDHKGFWLRVPGPQVERRKGRLRPAPQWHKPAHLPKVEWERLLAQAWREEVAGSAAYAALTRSLRNEPSRSQQRVQKDWDAFMRCLALCFFNGLCAWWQRARGQKLRLRRKLCPGQGLRPKADSLSFSGCRRPAELLETRRRAKASDASGGSLRESTKSVALALQAGRPQKGFCREFGGRRPQA